LIEITTALNFCRVIFFKIFENIGGIKRLEGFSFLILEDIFMSFCLVSESLKLLIYRQGCCGSGKSGKNQGIVLVREKSEK